jgi:hypothetical protein
VAAVATFTFCYWGVVVMLVCGVSKGHFGSL